MRLFQRCRFWSESLRLLHNIVAKWLSCRHENWHIYLYIMDSRLGDTRKYLDWETQQIFHFNFRIRELETWRMISMMMNFCRSLQLSTRYNYSNRNRRAVVSHSTLLFPHNLRMRLVDERRQWAHSADSTVEWAFAAIGLFFF